MLDWTSFLLKNCNVWKKFHVEFHGGYATIPLPISADSTAKYFSTAYEKKVVSLVICCAAMEESQSQVGIIHAKTVTISKHI